MKYIGAIDDLSPRLIEAEKAQPYRIFSICPRYRWVHPIAALIGRFNQQPTESETLLRFHTGGSNVSSHQMVLPCRVG